MATAPVGAAQVSPRPLPYRPEPSLVSDRHSDEHPVALSLAYDVTTLVTPHNPPVVFDVLIEELPAGAARCVLLYVGYVSGILLRIDGVRDPLAGIYC